MRKIFLPLTLLLLVSSAVSLSAFAYQMEDEVYVGPYANIFMYEKTKMPGVLGTNDSSVTNYMQENIKSYNTTSGEDKKVYPMIVGASVLVPTKLRKPFFHHIYVRGGLLLSSDFRKDLFKDHILHIVDEENDKEMLFTSRSSSPELKSMYRFSVGAHHAVPLSSSNAGSIKLSIFTGIGMDAMKLEKLNLKKLETVGNKNFVNKENLAAYAKSTSGTDKTLTQAFIDAGVNVTSSFQSGNTGLYVSAGVNYAHKVYSNQKDWKFYTAGKAELVLKPSSTDYETDKFSYTFSDDQELLPSLSGNISVGISINTSKNAGKHQSYASIS